MEIIAYHCKLMLNLQINKDKTRQMAVNNKSVFSFSPFVHTMNVCLLLSTLKGEDCLRLQVIFLNVVYILLYLPTPLKGPLKSYSKSVVGTEGSNNVLKMNVLGFIKCQMWIFTKQFWNCFVMNYYGPFISRLASRL